jgi:hypothetical protein
MFGKKGLLIERNIWLGRDGYLLYLAVQREAFGPLRRLEMVNTRPAEYTIWENRGWWSTAVLVYR